MKRLTNCIIILLAPFVVNAELFSFSAITSNDPSGTAQTIGESQLFMDVIETGPGQVDILFTNAGPAASSVREIYFDTSDSEAFPPVNLNISQFNNGPGVLFVNGARPPNLPGGSLINFVSVESAQSRGSSSNGINPYEYLMLKITYNADPYAFLDMLESGDIRVGLHVGGIGDYSESLVNNLTSIATIPEPAPLVLFVATLTSIAFVRRRFIA